MFTITTVPTRARTPLLDSGGGHAVNFVPGERERDQSVGQ